MTERHCIIGNSHIASLKLGWDQIKSEHQDHELSFFGAPCFLIDNLRVVGRTIVTSDERTRRYLERVSGGLSSIELDAYDTIWLVGMGVSVRRAELLYRRCRSEMHDDLGKRQVILSADAYQQCVTNLFADSFGAQLARQLCEGGSDVALMGAPLPGRGLADTDVRWSSLMDGGPAGWDGVAGTFRDAIEAVTEPYGARAVSQPAGTLDTPVTTLAEYFDGAARMGIDKDHEDGEYFHTNQAFGARVIEEHMVG